MALDNLVDLSRAVEQVESGGRRYDKSGKLLESGKGAQGEMQVMPGTVRDPGFGVMPARDDSADEIARVGRDYLAKMVDRYGNTEHALVAYNWGPTKADKWVGAGANKAKLPKETRDYLSKVNRQMVGSREATVEQPTVAAVTAPSEPAKSGVGGGTGVSRIRTLADNSPNFKAALAAHMLSLSSVGDDGEEDDEERTAAQEALDSMQEEPAQALDLDLTYSSPFRALQPEVAPAPMRFAGGGFVPKAAYSPTEKRELEDFNNQWQGYQDQYDTWRKEQYDPYQAAYEKYQTEVYNPYQTAYKAYESDYDKYVQAIGAWNEGPRTSPYAGPAQPTAPTQLTEFTMPAPTGSPIPPGLTQEAYAGMDQAALDKYAQEQSAAASARATQASADQRNRQSALNVAFNPEQFNLSLPDRIASRFMAEGGEARARAAQLNQTPEGYNNGGSAITQDDLDRALADIKARFEAAGLQVSVDGVDDKRKELDPRAAEEAAYKSRNLTKKTDPDSWPSPGNPKRSIPNAPRDYPTRAGQELLEFLQQLDRTPTVVESRRVGRGYEGPKFSFSRGDVNDPGVVRFPAFAKDPYRSLVHELTHSADRAMGVGYQQLVEKAKSQGLTAAEQQVLDGYQKLYGTATRLPLTISDPDLSPALIRYRTSADELRAFGTGNMAQSQPEPGRYNFEDIGATLNPHVDPTMAQEAAIMRDLYLRSGAVRGRAEGSPPEGEYADPEAAFMAGAGDVPAPNAENAAAALAAIRGLGEYPYNLVGGGVDLATMAMRPFGYDVEKPVMGSDWIKEKATQLGIRPPEETDPTLRDIRMGTEIATSVLDPFAGARAVAQGVQKTGQAARMLEDMTIGNMQRAKIRGAAEQVPDDAAYAPLRERMEAQGNLAMAVKPVGGYFQAGAYSEIPDAIPAYIAGAVGKSDVPAVQQFVDKQMTDYLGKTMGSPKDPLRIALDEGRTPFLKYDDPDLENTGLDAFGKNPNVDRVVRSTRRATGFPEEGYAQTEKGEKFEKYVDWMVSPENPQDLILGQLPPRLKKQAEDAAKQQGIEVSNDSVLSDLFGEDTNAVLGIGPSESIYSFFDEYKVLNLQATKSMLEKMLTDPTLPERYRLAPDDLSQMTMADASVAAKKADNYLVREAEKNLLAAADTLPTTVIYPDKARWLAPDDVIVNPDHRAVVRALGKKGGWCTKNENEVDMYGANNNRLNILMGPNKKPSVQVTTTAQDRTAEDWFNTLSDEQMEVGEATYAQYLQENNIPPMSMSRFEREYGLEQVFYDNPSFKDFQSRQQDVAWEIQTASFEQGGSKSKFTDYQFNKVMDLVRTRGARFDPNDRTIKQMESADGGRPLLKDLEVYFRPFSDGKNSYLDQKRALFSAAEERFKDTTISAPEFVQLMRDPKVAALFPDMNGINSTFAGVSPDAFVYPKGEELVPVVDFKRFSESTMGQVGKTPPQGFANGGLVERNVYNHQKYL